MTQIGGTSIRPSRIRARGTSDKIGEEKIVETRWAKSALIRTSKDRINSQVAEINQDSKSMDTIQVPTSNRNVVEWNQAMIKHQLPQPLCHKTVVTTTTSNETIASITISTTIEVEVTHTTTVVVTSSPTVVMALQTKTT